MAVSHRGGAGQASGLRRVPQRRDPEEAGRAAGGRGWKDFCLGSILISRSTICQYHSDEDCESNGSQFIHRQHEATD